jgi:hypothetical protein
LTSLFSLPQKVAYDRAQDAAYAGRAVTMYDFEHSDVFLMGTRYGSLQPVQSFLSRGEALFQVDKDNVASHQSRPMRNFLFTNNFQQKCVI